MRTPKHPGSNSWYKLVNKKVGLGVRGGGEERGHC